MNLLKLVAERFGVVGAALDYIGAAGTIGERVPEVFFFPRTLRLVGSRLFARGLLNRSFFEVSRDWILPFWAERQWDPRDPGFVGDNFQQFALNTHYRDWTMLGNLDSPREALVDPRGMLTPWFDGWSLDVWVEVDDNFFAPAQTRADLVEQHLHENLPILSTTLDADRVRVTQEAFCTGDDAEDEWVLNQIRAENLTPAAHAVTLYIALRPFNPEGVSLVKTLEYRAIADFGIRISDLPICHLPSVIRHQSAAFFVNGALAVLLPQPDAHALSKYKDGDVAWVRHQPNNAARVECEVGMATGVAIYRFDLAPGERRAFVAAMPMQSRITNHESSDSYIIAPASYSYHRDLTIARWRDKVAEGMRIRIPDEKLQNAFDANKAYLLLFHDGDTITPGSLTYHDFWLRDAAFLLHALDKLGYHDESARVLKTFARYQTRDGQYVSQEGEFDGTGQALWTMAEHTRLSGDVGFVADNYWKMLNGAHWIDAKRQKTKGRKTPHEGLLPPGPSAEHLGPADYFYWDDWWGLAGLREVARVAEMLGQTKDVEKLRAQFEAFRADVEASLASASERLGKKILPVSLYRRADSAMVGSLVGLYPLRVLTRDDARIWNTIDELRKIAWVNDAFFHDAHAGFGTYLALHIAGCYLYARRAEAWQMIRWLVQHASPTFTWAEAISPKTLRGGMGDGHHGWAAADFVLAMRNALLFEEDDHLVITPALPEEWTTPDRNGWGLWTFETATIKVENAPTYFGAVSFTIAFGERAGTLVLNGQWRNEPEYVEWNLPFAIREAGADAGDAQVMGNAVRLPRGARKVVAMW
jgi:hypothetical protein